MIGDIVIGFLLVAFVSMLLLDVPEGSEDAHRD